MLPQSSRDRLSRLIPAAVSVLVLIGCGDKPKPSGATSAAPTQSAAPARSAAPAGSAAASEGANPTAARADGTATFTPIAEVAACKVKTAEMATYLQRTVLSLAGRGSDGTIAAVWLIELQNNPDAQIAFAGFDSEGKQAARPRPLGATRNDGLRVFETGGAWTATWFEAEGLTHAQPRWETTPPPEKQRVSAIGKEAGENVVIAATPAGSLVAASPFEPAREQLSLFLFAPVDKTQPAVKAVGVTHHAKRPRRPAVAADAGGYFVAWHEEEEGTLMASRFDLVGKEGEAQMIAASGPKREELTLVATSGGGALAVWIEGDAIMARALDSGAKPSAGPWVVGKGRARAVAPSAPGAVVAWIGSDGKTDGQVLLTRLAADGTPSAAGLRVTDGATTVKDPPAIAVAGARVGVAWTEPMSPGVSTKRATLRVLDAACIP